MSLTMDAPSKQNLLRRLLLFTNKLGYQTRSFEAAAQKHATEIIYVTDRCHRLEDPWGDRAIPVHFESAQSAAASVVAALNGKSVDGLLALGDAPSVAAAYTARELGISYNHPASVEACRSKLRMREVFQQSGLNTPWFRVMNLDPLPEPALLGISYPCVLKPLSLSASRGVIRANNRDEFVSAAQRIRNLLESPEVRATREAHLDQIFVEGYIPGKEVAVEGLLTAGVVRVLAIFDKPDPLEGPYFEETIYVTPSSLTESQQLAIQKCAQDSARAIGLTRGPVHVEFRIHGDGEAGTGVWPLEIAARPIGGLCARALRFVENESQTLENKNATTQASIGLEELLLLHSLDLPVSTWMRERRASGVMMIPVPSSGILESVQGEAAARETPGITELLITARLHDYIEAWPEGASYLGFLFAAAETPREVEQTLRDAHAKLRFTMIPRLPVQHPAQHASGKSAR
ncbi:MAG TPA: ATP-grasp domain-containing protein [Verrucomicrobiae bacterium]|nr:ATP-grasp domain-containing protein [Verrucomicrobiae bacterium]